MKTYAKSNFAGTAGEAFSSTVPIVGGTWSTSGFFGGNNLTLDGAGNVYGPSGQAFFPSIAPTAQEYDQFHVFNKLDAATDVIGAFARAVSTAQTYYWFRHDGANYQIVKIVGGGYAYPFSQYVGPLPVGVYRWKIQVRNAYKALYVNFGDGHWVRVGWTNDNGITGTESNGNNPVIATFAASTTTAGTQQSATFLVQDPQPLLGGSYDATQPSLSSDLTLFSSYGADLLNDTTGGGSAPVNATPGVSGWWTGNPATTDPLSYPANDVTIDAGGYYHMADATYGNLMRNAEGIMGWDQWTIEETINCSVAWSTQNGPILYQIGGATYNWLIKFAGGTVNLIVQDYTVTPQGGGVYALFPTTGQDFDATLGAGVDVKLGLSFNAGTLVASINNVVVGRLTGLPVKPFMGSGPQGGLQINGYPGAGQTNCGRKDLRIRRYARVIGRVPTIPAVAVTANPSGAAIDTMVPFRRGGLHCGVDANTLAHAGESIGGGHIASDKELVACPVSTANSTTTPTAGRSAGSPYFYGWQPMYTGAALGKTVGATMFFKFGQCPQYLGGATAPFSGAAYASNPASFSSDAPQVPTDAGNGTGTSFTKFATMVADQILEHRAWCASNGVTFPLLWGSWNEPTTGYWPAPYTDGGTPQTQYVAMTVAVLQKMATLGIAGLKLVVGGGLNPANATDAAWINKILAAVVSNGLTNYVAGVEIHDYTGDTLFPLAATNALEAICVAVGYPAGKLAIHWGECNWDAGRSVKNGGGYPAPFTTINNAQNDFAGAWLARSFMSRIGLATAHVGPFIGYTYTNTTFTEGSDQYGVMGLVSSAHVGINHNVMRLIKSFDGWNVVTQPAEIYPGVVTTGLADGRGEAGFLVSFLGEPTAAPVTVNFAMTGLAGKTANVTVIDKHSGDYFDGGTQTLPAPTVKQIDSAGNLQLTLNPRSIVSIQSLATPPIAPVIIGTQTASGVLISVVAAVPNAATLQLFANDVLVASQATGGIAPYPFAFPAQPSAAAGSSVTYYAVAVDAAGNSSAPSNEYAGSGTVGPQKLVALALNRGVPTGAFTVVTKDTYFAADGRAFAFTPPAGAIWPTNLAGWTVIFSAAISAKNQQCGNAAYAQSITTTGVVQYPAPPLQVAYVEFASPVLSSLAPGVGECAYDFDVVAVNGADRVCLARGKMNSVSSVTA